MIMFFDFDIYNINCLYPHYGTKTLMTKKMPFFRTVKHHIIAEDKVAKFFVSKSVKVEKTTPNFIFAGNEKP